MLSDIAICELIKIVTFGPEDLFIYILTLSLNLRLLYNKGILLPYPESILRGMLSNEIGVLPFITITCSHGNTND